MFYLLMYDSGRLIHSSHCHWNLGVLHTIQCPQLRDLVYSKHSAAARASRWYSAVVAVDRQLGRRAVSRRSVNFSWLATSHPCSLGQLSLRLQRAAPTRSAGSGWHIDLRSRRRRLGRSAAVQSKSSLSGAVVILSVCAPAAAAGRAAGFGGNKRNDSVGAGACAETKVDLVDQSRILAESMPADGLPAYVVVYLSSHAAAVFHCLGPRHRGHPAFNLPVRLRVDASQILPFCSSFFRKADNYGGMLWRKPTMVQHRRSQDFLSGALFY